MKKQRNLGINVKNLIDYEKKIPLKHINFDVEIIGSRATIQMSQRYENNAERSLDIDYMFPILARSCLIEFVAATDDKTYIGIVGEKKKVEEYSKELQEKGITHAVASNFGDFKDIVKIFIGDLQPYQTLLIQLKFTVFLEAVTSTAFRLRIPVVLLERISNPTNQSFDSKNKQQEGGIKEESPSLAIAHSTEGNYTYGFEIVVHKEDATDVQLHNIEPFTTDQIKVTEFIDKKIFKLAGSNELPTTDIFFLFKRSPSDSTVPTASDQLHHKVIIAKTATLEAKNNSLISRCAYTNFMMATDPHSKDVSASIKPSVFVLLMDVSCSMAGIKLNIMKEAAKLVINNIKDHNLVLVAKFAADLELLTASSGAVLASAETKEYIKNQIDSITKEDIAQANGLNITRALKECFDNDALTSAEYQHAPRSFIILSNGNASNETSLDALLSVGSRKHETRVSAIGIGSGSADYFLQKIVTKGQGIFEVLGSPEHINERVNFFMKRLNNPTFKILKYEILDPSIIQVLPTPQKSVSYLKGTPFEVFVYMKDRVEYQSKVALNLYYQDGDDCIPKKIGLMLQHGQVSNPLDLFKICIHELLYQAAENTSLNPIFEEQLGSKWATSLAIQNNILTENTAFIAVAVEEPPVFDPNDLSEIEESLEQKSENLIEKPDEGKKQANERIHVKNMVADDYLRGIDQCETKKIAPVKSFNARQFNLKSKDLAKNHSATGSTKSGNFLLKGSRSTKADRSEKDSLISAEDEMDIKGSKINQILFESDPHDLTSLEKAKKFFMHRKFTEDLKEDEMSGDFSDLSTTLKPFISIREPQGKQGGSPFGLPSESFEEEWKIENNDGMQAGEESVDLCQEIINRQQEDGNWEYDTELVEALGLEEKLLSMAVVRTKVDMIFVITFTCLHFLMHKFKDDSRTAEAIEKCKEFLFSSGKVNAKTFDARMKLVIDIVLKKK